MGDKGWLCVICGHFINEVLPNQILPEGGRVHTYCQEVEKATEEGIIQLLRSQVTKHHPILEIDIDELEALIRGEQK